MLKITFTSKDAALAERIAASLRNAGYDGKTQTRHDILIAVVSPEANADSQVQQAIIAALDNSQHIIPVLATPAELPKLIDHLDVVDFSATYAFEALREKVEAALAPDAPLPLRVRTPMVKRSNRVIGIGLGLLALLWFALGIYGVGVMGLQAPQDEYDLLATEAELTQAFLMNPELDRYAQFLPEDEAQAQNYAATLRAVPTVYRPYMAATATAVGMGTPLATSAAFTLGTEQAE